MLKAALPLLCLLASFNLVASQFSGNFPGCAAAAMVPNSCRVGAPCCNNNVQVPFFSASFQAQSQCSGGVMTAKASIDVVYKQNRFDLTMFVTQTPAIGVEDAIFGAQCFAEVLHPQDPLTQPGNDNDICIDAPGGQHLPYLSETITLACSPGVTQFYSVCITADESAFLNAPCNGFPSIGGRPNSAHAAAPQNSEFCACQLVPVTGPVTPPTCPPAVITVLNSTEPGCPSCPDAIAILKKVDEQCPCTVATEVFGTNDFGDNKQCFCDFLNLEFTTPNSTVLARDCLTCDAISSLVTARNDCPLPLIDVCACNVNTQPPVIVAPANITIDCKDCPNDDFSFNSCKSVTGSPLFTAVCNRDVTVVPSDVRSSIPGCATSFLITRTFTATDSCGRTATAVQLITVVDQVGPSVSASLSPFHQYDSDFAAAAVSSQCNPPTSALFTVNCAASEHCTGAAITPTAVIQAILRIDNSRNVNNMNNMNNMNNLGVMGDWMSMMGMGNLDALNMNMNMNRQCRLVSRNIPVRCGSTVFISLQSGDVNDCDLESNLVSFRNGVTRINAVSVQLIVEARSSCGLINRVHFNPENAEDIHDCTTFLPNGLCCPLLQSPFPTVNPLLSHAMNVPATNMPSALGGMQGWRGLLHP